jgi:hypothetical protein
MFASFLHLILNRFVEIVFRRPEELRVAQIHLSRIPGGGGEGHRIATHGSAQEGQNIKGGL